MKKLIIISLLIVLSMFLNLSCESNSVNDELNNTAKSNQVKLSSPNGKVLANTIDQLKAVIINNSSIPLESSSIDVITVEYLGENFSSVAIVDYEVGSSFKSLLVPLGAEEKYSVLLDKKSLYIIENTSVLDKNIAEKDNVLFFDDIYETSISENNLSNRTAYTCVGDSCCRWRQTGASQYNCGCLSAKDEQLNNKKLRLTTSDDCAIEITAE